MEEVFNKASKMPWYRNTLFVITADHCSSNIVFPESRTTWGLWSIPIIFFKPDNSLAGLETEIVQQIDIMPSVLGYLHYDKPYVSFGRDVFREERDALAYNFREAYNLLEGEYLLTFDGQKPLRLYNYRSDKMLTRDLRSEFPLTVEQMEIKLKAIIQQYNNRMMEDRLVVE
jgi:phosphoglycerol transferase MdoB-like AlkP superfamily enzyme